MLSADDPIGVLDSGLGGLSVLKALRRELPGERFVYCADCAHAPWGDKSEAYVVERTRAIVRFLLENKAKAVVLACNTATAAAADVIRREVEVPVIGIEPAVKPAAASTKTGVIGVLATRGTVQSERYRSLLTRFTRNVRVISTAAPGLMECVERGDFEGPETLALLEKYLLPMRQAGVDRLVLGCTHYPFLAEPIARLMGPDVELLEPGLPVALETRRRLAALGLLCYPQQNPADASETPSLGAMIGESAPCRYLAAGAAAHAGTFALLAPDARRIEELTV